MEIGAFATVFGLPCGTYPVHFPSMRILRLDHRFGLMPLAKPRRNDACERIEGQVRYIHVQQIRALQALEPTQYDVFRHFRRRIQMLPAMLDMRKSDRRNSEQKP